MPLAGVLQGSDWIDQRNTNYEQRERQALQFPLEQERRRFELDRAKEQWGLEKPEWQYRSQSATDLMQRFPKEQERRNQEQELAIQTLKNAGLDARTEGYAMAMLDLKTRFDPDNPQSIMQMGPQQWDELRNFMINKVGFDPGYVPQVPNQEFIAKMQKAFSAFDNWFVGLSANRKQGANARNIREQGDVASKLSSQGYRQDLGTMQQKQIYNRENQAYNRETQIMLQNLERQTRVEVARIAQEGRTKAQQRLEEAIQNGDAATAAAINAALTVGKPATQSIEEDKEGNLTIKNTSAFDTAQKNTREAMAQQPNYTPGLTPYRKDKMKAMDQAGIEYKVDEKGNIEYVVSPENKARLEEFEKRFPNFRSW